MKIETKFQEGFKNLLKEKSLDEISVISLCEKVESNRQTFYYHFRDINDVIDSILILLRNSFQKQFDNIILLTKSVLRFVSAHNEFLKKLVDAELSEKVYDLFYSFYYRNILKMLPKDLEKDIFNQVSRLTSHLFSKETLIYLSSSRKENQNKIANKFSVIYNYFVNLYPKEISL